MNKHKRTSLHELANELRETTSNIEDTFSYMLRNFLDDFYSADRDEKVILLKECPCLLREIANDGGVIDAYMAAIANHLSSQYELVRPHWSSDETRRPDRPWFAMTAAEPKIWLLTQSPAAFRERDLFITADALSRA